MKVPLPLTMVFYDTVIDSWNLLGDVLVPAPNRQNTRLRMYAFLRIPQIVRALT